MRVRTNCNPFMDQHYLKNPNWSMRVYEFITHAGTEPHSVAECIEYVVPDLAVYARGTIQVERIWVKDPVTGIGKWEQQAIEYLHDSKTGIAHGAVWTSWHEDENEADPCLHVAIGLYDQPCGDLKCIAGHKGVAIAQARQLESWEIDGIKEEVGEHPSYHLGVSVLDDRRILSSLGLTPLDAPIKGEAVGWENLYKALDYLARTSTKTFTYKVSELIRLGYAPDMDIVKAIAKTRRLDEELILVS